MKRLIFCVILLLAGCGQIEFSPVSQDSLSVQDQDFSDYLTSLYADQAFPICQDGLPKDSCEQWFEGLTTKEIWLQQEFFRQNGVSPLIKDFQVFTGVLAQLFFPFPLSEPKLQTIPWVFNFYTFIAGSLKVKGKFVLEEKPLEVLEFCDFANPSAPCQMAFSHISKLTFELSEAAHEDFPKGSQIEVWCWNTQTSRLFFDYELVDLEAKTFQFFTKIADNKLNSLIAESLKKKQNQTFLLHIAPNARYATEDLLCPNYYFLNPQKLSHNAE